MSTERNEPDFHCHICGADTNCAPPSPQKAVCPDHCEDHEYITEHGEVYCAHCGQFAPHDYHVED